MHKKRLHGKAGNMKYTNKYNNNEKLRLTV